MLVRLNFLYLFIYLLYFPGFLIMSSVRDTVIELATQSGGVPPSERLQRCRELLQQLTRDIVQNVEDVKAYARAMVEETVSLVISRPMLTELARGLSAAVTQGAETWTTAGGNGEEQAARKATMADVGETLLQLLQPRLSNFEEQASVVRVALADIYELDEDWQKCAQILASIPLDSGHRWMSIDQRFSIYLRIAAYCLEDGDAVQAEAYVKRAALIASESSDPKAQLQYRVQQARILDAKRKFQEAAQRYTEVSFLLGAKEHEAQLMALREALHCAILAPAGPRRSRLLAMLYKDERCRELPAFSILRNMYLDRIIKEDQVAAFAALVYDGHDHRRAPNADGTTVLERAVLQHNMLSASKVYDSITFPELGRLLHVDANRAEAVAAQMIGEGRMAGSIDQVDALLRFRGGGTGGPSADTIMAWDDSIRSVCLEVNNVVDRLGELHPEWLKARTA